MTQRLKAPVTLVILVATAALAVLSMVIGYRIGPLVLPAAAIAAGGAAVAVTHLRWTLYASLLAIPLEQLTIPGTGGLLTPSQSLMMLVALGWLFRVCLERKALLGGTPAIPALGLFLIITVVSATMAVDSVAAAKVTLLTAVLLLVLHFVVTEGDGSMVRGLVASITLSAVAVSILSVAGAGGSAQTYLGNNTLTRASGVFQAPNTLATFFAMALPGAAILAFVGPPTRRAAGAAAVALLAVGVTSTFSRGGILAAGVSVLVLCVFGPFRNRLVLALAVVVLVLASGVRTLGDVSYLDTLSGRIASVGAASQGADPRVGIWRGSLKMIGDRPLLGVGPGSFQVAAPRYGLYYPLGTDQLLVPPHAHDLLLNIWVERGLFAALAFLAFLIAIARHCVRAVREAARRSDRAYAVGVSAALVAFFTQDLVDYTFATNPIALTFIVLSGCAVVLARSP